MFTASPIELEKLDTIIDELSCLTLKMYNFRGTSTSAGSSHETVPQFSTSELVSWMEAFARHGYEAVSVSELGVLLTGVGLNVRTDLLEDMVTILEAKGYAQRTIAGHIQLTE